MAILEMNRSKGMHTVAMIITDGYATDNDSALEGAKQFNV